MISEAGYNKKRVHRKMDETLITKRSEIRRKLIPLEWDKKLNQINYAREMELVAYRKELETIEKDIAGSA